MKRKRIAGSNLPIRSGCLSRNCGTNLDIEDIDFSRQKPNLVYMDKVFSFNDATSCPLLLNLNTGCKPHKFETQLTLSACGCNLIPCTLEPNSVFTIDNSFVVVEYFNTRPPGNINPCQVTIDGFNVDSVCYTNGQYVAKTANVIPRIQKDKCLNKDLPTKAFFLITDAGPWDFRAKFVLEGTVNTGGRNCRFCLVITNAENSCNIPLPCGSLSDFAIPDLALPCSINSIAPDVLFQFTANIEMINPRLLATCEVIPATVVTVAGVEDTDTNTECHHFPIVSSLNPNACTVTGVTLETTLAIEPIVHVEVIRQTLFCVNACEGLQPCQGSLAAALEEEEEECNLQDIIGPDCRCKDKDDDVAGIRDCKCRDRVGGQSICEEVASNRTCGGVTMGVGTCEDCNDGVLGERTKKDRVLGDSFCKDVILGKGTCRDRVGGANICDLLCEILDILGDSTCDNVGGVCGLGVDGTWGCGCRDDVRGIRDRDDRKTRTAFQFNGCNGCSW